MFNVCPKATLIVVQRVKKSAETIHRELSVRTQQRVTFVAERSQTRRPVPQTPNNMYHSHSPRATGIISDGSEQGAV
jgi:hypothetical protein